MFDKLVQTGSDINEHLPTLRDLASECKSVTEMGVRYIVSTWAFVEGLKEGKLTSIDIKHPSFYGGDITLIEKACKEKEIDFKFIEASTLDITIEKTDLLFIDTLHTYLQLKEELERHSSKVSKYIVIHDTVSCPEQNPAIDELVATKKWKVKIAYVNNNGLTILEKCLQPRSIKAKA